MNEVILGDCLEVMKTMPDKSVDLVVTSPPYDNLRDYKGYIFDFEGIARELLRLIKDGGVVVWVVGDATIDGSESGTSFKQALFFKEIGFNLHDTMIYMKINPIPLTHRRYEQVFEYMFILSKGKPKTFNPLIIKTKNPNKEETRQGRSILDKKQARRHKGREWGKTKESKFHENVFSYVVGQNKNGHPATFPEQLVQDQIYTWSNENEIVLDPFSGSGTTPVIAKQMGRDFIGIEISPEYVKIAQDRLSALSEPLF